MVEGPVGFPIELALVPVYSDGQLKEAPPLSVADFPLTFILHKVALNELKPEGAFFCEQGVPLDPSDGIALVINSPCRQPLSL
jgi:hypothetical protein